jgi:hypothetical protein
MSKRTGKHALESGDGVAVMERSAAEGTDAPVTEPSIVATVTKVLKKADAEAFDKLSTKLQPSAAAAAESKVVKVIKVAKGKAMPAQPPMAPNPQPAGGGMVAAFYLRTSGCAALPKGTYGALLQTQAMAGTLKGRQCRHPHMTAAEAIVCAKAMAPAVKVGG